MSTFELFRDGASRWVLTENFDEENAPVFRTIQDAYEWCVEHEEVVGDFRLIVHGKVQP